MRKGDAELVNTVLLEKKINDSGKKRSFLAKQCNCSIQSLRLKVLGKYDFTSSQIEALCEELNITDLAEKECLFFAKNVDNMPT